jgi:hypothetical protein
VNIPNLHTLPSKILAPSGGNLQKLLSFQWSLQISCNGVEIWGFFAYGVLMFSLHHKVWSKMSGLSNAWEIFFSDTCFQIKKKFLDKGYIFF